MRSLMLVFLMAISAFGADDSANATLVRVSGGLGAGSFGLVAGGRILAGVGGSPWRYGVQAMGMSEMRLFVTPNENVSTLCFVVGRELVPTGAFSFTVFGGGGFAASELRGREISSGWLASTYESERYSDPALLVGGDLSTSYRRHFGASLQFGVHASRVTTTYAVLQIDVGSW